MKISPAGKPGVPVTPASGFANGDVGTCSGKLTSVSGWNGGASVPFWKKSPCPGSVS